MRKTWCDWIVEAMRSLNGKARYEDLYIRLREIRSGDFSDSWQATVRNVIESKSSDSENYREGQPDLFYAVEGKGKGYWVSRPEID